MIDINPLYNKQFTELTEEEKKIIITNEETNTREELKVDMDKFLLYWSTNPQPQIKPDIIKVIKRA